MWLRGLGGAAAALAAGTAYNLTRERPWTVNSALSPEAVLATARYPEAGWVGPEPMTRINNVPDREFYGTPRIGVHHLDPKARAALARYYAQLPVSEPADVLDLGSSWTSHIERDPSRFRRVSGLGINRAELAANTVLDELEEVDLNAESFGGLSYAADSFDLVLCSLSVGYLVRPVEVFKEINRVLRPGGLAVVSFGDRMFVGKAVKAWRLAGEKDKLWIVGSYFHYAGGFMPAEATQLDTAGGDPVYVVQAFKKAGARSEALDTAAFTIS